LLRERPPQAVRLLQRVRAAAALCDQHDGARGGGGARRGRRAVRQLLCARSVRLAQLLPRGGGAALHVLLQLVERLHDGLALRLLLRRRGAHRL
jgi:hypothetical protein